MYSNKQDILYFFREQATKDLAIIKRENKFYKDNASAINTAIKNTKENEIKKMLHMAMLQKWDNEAILKSILMLNYAAVLVMLEFRNKVWAYDYMAFARRVGELWEPFCKETFAYPVKKLKLINAPDFENVQDEIKKAASDYIDALPIDIVSKRKLHYYYRIPWSMVDSGGIKLELDLHFSQNNINYNCDFKSGFSSNEKGNTNRLLLVASIYRFLGDKEKTLLFVRQDEDMNNHYLQTLKNSKYWDVYCANDAYRKMAEFTGFDLRKWLDENAHWEEDMEARLRNQLKENDLIKYLTW